MPYNILLVDDDREFRTEFKDAFFEEYEIKEASNGEEALQILKKPNEIDLVVLDNNMPGPRGTEVLKEMKVVSPDLRIVMMTGYSSEDVAIEALKGHADSFLTKPLNVEEAKETINELLGTRKGEIDITTADAAGKMEKVKQFIERNCFKKISLNDAAQVVCLSPKYLSRLFNEVTKKSFIGYKIGVKMKKAKELLVSTGATINQISYKLGYENAESFIRQFKKLTGATPTEYRRKALKVRPLRSRRKTKK
ncbi:MAG: DNA-binding response regulator [Candidatus Omnitrophica bacterium]|nr:DNA-binding response regulator [Candidatus Omnitrophota bacterium]